MKFAMTVLVTLFLSAPAHAFFDLNFGQWVGSGIWTDSGGNFQIDTNLVITANPDNSRGKYFSIGYVAHGVGIQNEGFWVYFQDEETFDIYTQQNYSVPQYDWVEDLDWVFSPTGHGSCDYFNNSGTRCSLTYNNGDVRTEETLTFINGGNVTRDGTRTFPDGKKERWNLSLTPKKRFLHSKKVLPKKIDIVKSP